MKRLLIVCALFSIGSGVFGQNIPAQHKKLVMVKDTLVLSDYMMSIDRVNDNLNTVRDSSGLKYEVVRIGKRVDGIEKDVVIIRKNIRGRGSAYSIKNLYLYQNFISDLNDENDRIEANVGNMYRRVYTAKLSLKRALSDSIFRMLYSSDSLRKTFDTKLARLERKYSRLDSTVKANVDTLNALKVKIADNAVNLSNMLNIMDMRLDRADIKLFGPEVNKLWQKAMEKSVSSSAVTVITKVESEKNAIGFYFNKKSKERAGVIFLGLLILIWLYNKRKLLKSINEPDSEYSFLKLKYLNNYPVLSVLVSLLCLMPFFDAYAPTSYIAIEHLLLLTLASVIFFRKKNMTFWFGWLVLVILFAADTLTYLFIEPDLLSRLWLLVLQAGIFLFTFLFYKRLNKDTQYYKLIRNAIIAGMILSLLGIVCNIFGRFSLSSILGISAIFAITQVIILPVFVKTLIEIILLQLQSTRVKKGFHSPFDFTAIVKKIRIPLLMIAVSLWLIMLFSNLNIYHSITNFVIDLFTTPFSVGNISFSLVNVLYFFVIIWFAHILQQLISFLFGETGIESEDVTPVSKKRHSKLLITRVLVLTGGYMLAIAASGLPIDKITILLGALGVGIGMGLQNIVNNFVSGIILIFNSSFRIGDEIEVSGQSGKVKEIGLRTSTLTTADGADVIIPNGNMLSQTIVNWTLTTDQKRITLVFNLAGKELDSNEINELINETIKNLPDVVSQKKPVILFTKVTPESCTLNVRLWTTIKKADDTKSQATLMLGIAFADKMIQFE